MNFLINSHYLLQNLKSIYSVLSKRNIWTSSYFLLKVKKNILKIKVEDLDLTIQTTLKVLTKNKGYAAVPAKLLMDILKNIQEQQLKIKTLRFNQIRITSVKGNYDISLLNYELFPKAKTIKNKTVCVLNKRTFLKIIENTLFAVGHDDLRPVMNGVCFSITKNQGLFVATNNKILAQYSLENLKNSTANPKFIIPKKTLLLVKKNLKHHTYNITLKYNKSAQKISFIFNNKRVDTSLIKGAFPSYDKLIKISNTNKLRINIQELKASIKRIKLFSNNKDNKINFSLSKKQVIIYAENKESTNKAYEELLCDYFGENLELSFNSNDLIEVLSNLNCEEIEIQIKRQMSPVLIKPISSIETEKILRLIVPLT